jgi:hypothetical protein
MGLFSKISSLFSRNETGKEYTSKDNLGTIYTDHRKVSASWQVQGMWFEKGVPIKTTTEQPSKDIIPNGHLLPGQMYVTTERISKGHPYVCYKFNNETDAKIGSSSLSFIKTASDTKELISLEILEFGCYETETPGIWEVTVWGENLTKGIFNEAKTKLEKAGGVLKGERVPVKDSPSGSQPIHKPIGKATYIRTDRKGQNTYEIYKAPSKTVALDFLKGKSVTKSFYYLIVETPEGNWGRDIDGIYQE